MHHCLPLPSLLQHVLQISADYIYIFRDSYMGKQPRLDYRESLNSRPSATLTIHLHFVSYILHEFSIEFVGGLPVIHTTNHLLSQ